MASVKVKKGFKVSCPFCGTDDEDGGITLNVADVRNLLCSSCDREFTPEEAVATVSEQLRRWEALARWIDSAAEMM